MISSFDTLPQLSSAHLRSRSPKTSLCPNLPLHFPQQILFSLHPPLQVPYPNKMEWISFVNSEVIKINQSINKKHLRLQRYTVTEIQAGYCPNTESTIYFWIVFPRKVQQKYSVITTWERLDFVIDVVLRMLS